MSNVGKNLQPAEFGLSKSESSIDRFGQPDKTPVDATHGDAPTAMAAKDAHRQSDVDSSQQSQHHTLGTNRNQASPGNHIHDGITSPKLGALAINTSGNDTKPTLVLTGSKGGNAALANLIAMLGNVINFTDNTT